MMKVVRVLVIVSLVVGVAAAGNAVDIVIGPYARYSAMGGAGLAVSDSGSESVMNPAAAAASGERLSYIYPSLEFHALGGSVRDVSGSLTDFWKGRDVAVLARDFGTQNTTLNGSFVIGFAGTFGATIGGEAEGTVAPGAAFRQWSSLGGPVTAADLLAWTLIPDTTPASLAVYAATLTASGTTVGSRMVYDLPAVSYSTDLPVPVGKLFTGARVRWMRSEVRNWNISSSSVVGGITVQATELPKVTDQGIGADLGFIYRPPKSKVQFGMVINNLIDPNLAGIPTAAMYSVGAAGRVTPRVLLVADVVDIGGASGTGAQLRIGGEYVINKKLALRAGMCDSTFTYGAHLYGLDIALASQAPYVISRTLRF